MAEEIKELDVVRFQGTVVHDFGDDVMIELSDDEGRGLAFPVLPRSQAELVWACPNEGRRRDDASHD